MYKIPFTKMRCPRPRSSADASSSVRRPEEGEAASLSRWEITMRDVSPMRTWAKRLDSWSNRVPLQAWLRR